MLLDFTDRKKCAQPVITQEKSRPRQRAHDHRREERFADPDVAGGCAAEIRRQQDSAQDGGLRNRIEESASELEYTDRKSQIGRASCRERGEISVVAGSLK